jgi:hypothetical protein
LYTLIRWGALFGGALAIFETLTYLLVLRYGTLGDYGAVSLFNLLLEGLVPLGAGIFAGRDTGEAGAGVVSGLTSGAIVALVSILYQAVVPVPESYLGGPTTLLDIVLGIGLATVMTLALGAWGGWIGGRWGAARSKRGRE